MKRTKYDLLATGIRNFTIADRVIRDLPQRREVAKEREDDPAVP